ncbi:tRNA (guanosine(46)-N7)-methyltransferase TrmB [soil metagenome]
MSGDRPHHQFYGRRKGYPLRRHHLELVEQLLPKIRVDLENPLPAGQPNRAMVLEIGFGGGEHLAHQAALHPQIDFIGAEPFLNGVAKLLALIEANGLANIRIHDGDARDLLDVLPAASLDRVYLLYPDPWPKARHNKRRFVSDETLREIHRVLKPGGLLMFASDIADYADWTERHVAAHGGFRLTGRDRFMPPIDWVETRYEAKAKREGQRPVYLSFARSN